MDEEPPSSQSVLAKIAVYLAGAALVFFVTGLVVGGMGPHRPGEETADMIALILCRVASPLLAVTAWLAGLVAMLTRPAGPVWSAVTAMMLVLIFWLLLCYSALRGTAAFHPIF
ncbi:MAG: hypothetical protein U1F71_23660 [Verrucomicrobiaceae bacterium]